jgi:hypothetical protein
MPEIRTVSMLKSKRIKIAPNVIAYYENQIAKAKVSVADKMNAQGFSIDIFILRLPSNAPAVGAKINAAELSEC